MEDDYEIRPVTESEVSLIKPLLDQLAAHHNEVAASFSGVYPPIPAASHIVDMKEHVRNGTAYIPGAFFPDGSLGGFGMASSEGTYGEVDYLVVREDMRGGGMGGALLDALLGYLARVGVLLIDVKVANGNPAITFYERYGFSLRCSVLSLRLPET